MTTDQIAGILASSSEREFIVLVIAALVSGVFSFVLALRLMGRDKDVILRLIEWKHENEKEEP